jgi:hypothetical protein
MRIIYCSQILCNHNVTCILYQIDVKPVKFILSIHKPMKKLIVLLLFLAAVKSASAQYTPANYDYVYLALGGGIPIINNKDFDNWSETNYHRKIYNDVEGSVDMGFVLKNYYAGFQVIGSGGDYQIANFTLGRRVTSLNSPITSYLNVGIGGFSDQIYSLAPVNFQRTPDEIGQSMYLSYTNLFLVLQSKNYINNLSFSISRNQRLYIRSGFYVNLNYCPWNAYWDYGYDKKTTKTKYDNSGNPYTVVTGSNFSGTRVTDVPALANKFMDVGVFMAISFSTSRKKGFYSK